MHSLEKEKKEKRKREGKRLSVKLKHGIEGGKKGKPLPLVFKQLSFHLLRLFIFK